MTRYIIEHNQTQSAWIVREHETGKQIGVMIKKGRIYLAESSTFNAQSHAADPVLALQSVFHTTEFYQFQSSILHKLTPENLRAFLGASIPGSPLT